MKPLISIIICVRNGEPFLKSCLASILAEKSEQYEIIVVNDASTDKTQQVMEQFRTTKNLKTISLKKGVGLSAARNIGAAKSEGAYLFYLDADTTIKPGWAKNIITFFKKYKNAGMAQVKILRKGTNQFDYAGDYMSTFGFIVDRARTNEDNGQFDSVEEIFSGKGAAMIIRKNVFLELSGFNEDFKFYLEDSDMMWRTWLGGYHVYFLPDVTVYHAYGTEDKNPNYYQKSDIDVQKLGCRNMLITHTKNWGIPRVFFVVLIQYITWTILGLLFFVSKNPQKGRSVFAGIISSIKAFPQTLKKRQMIQSKRKISDTELMKRVGIQQGLSYYFGKARSYILGRPF